MHFCHIWLLELWNQKHDEEEQKKSSLSFSLNVEFWLKEFNFFISTFRKRENSEFKIGILGRKSQFKVFFFRSATLDTQPSQPLGAS